MATDDLFRTIVVGTDGSERAGIAVRRALALAKVSGATVHAVHAVHPTVAAGFVDSMGAQFDITAMREEGERIRAQLVEQAEREGVRVEVHAPDGDPADALINIAEAVDADLIVVGNRGMTGVTRFVLGSVPNKVSHHSPCSLLIVDTG